MNELQLLKEKKESLEKIVECQRKLIKLKIEQIVLQQGTKSAIDLVNIMFKE